MNEPQAVLGSADDETPQSPRRKKVRRQKYAPKACVSCRRSKLKCSGENPPCQRCHDSGKRCFYSEDQTAAEALQTLRRPPAGSPLATANPALSHHHSRDVPTLSMEARMARMEALMHAVLHDRVGSVVPIDDHTNNAFSASSPSSIYLGTRRLAFPAPSEYQRYCALFFSDLNLLYPCLDEPSFRASSSHMLTAAVVPPTDTCLLALHYIMFACIDILHDPTTASIGKPPGWEWFHIADSIVGKRPQYGCGDVDLAQFLLFQALYFTFAEQPNLAYSAIGMASRLVLQHGLHRQSSYSNLTAIETLSRLRTFWSVYVVDRRISLSCRRPYSIRESDVDVEWSGVLQTRETYTGSTPHDTDANSIFIACMIHWSHLAGSAWDRLSLATASQGPSKNQDVAMFDVQITQYRQSTLTALIDCIWADPRLYHISMSLADLSLLVTRSAILSLEFTPETAHICTNAVVEIIARSSHLSSEGHGPCFKRHATSSLASALLVLCAILVHNFQHPEGIAPETRCEGHVQRFRQVLAALCDLASTLPYAQRILDDFSAITSLLNHIIDTRERHDDPTHLSTDLTDVDAIIPHNILEMLPYRDLNPVLHTVPQWSIAGEQSLSLDVWDGSVDWRDGGRVLWV